MQVSIEQAKADLLHFFEDRGFFKQIPEDFKTDLDPIKEGEKSLGVMNEFEKMCYAFLTKKSAEHEDIHLRMESEDAEIANQANKEHNQLEIALSVAKNMMWSSIRTRIPCPEDASGFALREDFNIIGMPLTSDDHMSGLEIIFGTGFPGGGRMGSRSRVGIVIGTVRE